ncbi:MAG: lysostaphin resistance A-like protein [Clostridiaceae bacterium]
MKKYLKLILNTLKYPLIYLAAQVVCGAIAGAITGIYYGIKYANEFSGDELNNLLMEKINGVIFPATFIAAVVCFFIYMLMLRNKEENLIKRCKFKKISFKNGIYIFFITTFLGFFSLSLIYYIERFFPSYSETSETIAGAYNSIFSVIIIIALIPIFEEILFRGLIFNELRHSLNITLSIILQAAIFGIFHGNPLQAIYTFIAGTVFCLVYYWTDSLYSSILAHITYNLMGSLLIPILFSYTEKFVMIYFVLGLVLTLFTLNLFRKSINIEKEEGPYISTNY